MQVGNINISVRFELIVILAAGGSPLLQRKLLIPVQQSRPLSHHCPDRANSRNPLQFSAAHYIKHQSSIQYLHQNQRKPYESIRIEV